MKLKLWHMPKNSFFQLIVNGENSENGVDVPKHAAREYKPELDRWKSLLDLEDNYVLDIQPNLNPANFKHAQVKYFQKNQNTGDLRFLKNYLLSVAIYLTTSFQRIVTGATSVSGVHAVNLVEMEFNLDLGTFNALQWMVEGIVPEDRKKRETVQRMLAQVMLYHYIYP